MPSRPRGKRDNQDNKDNVDKPAKRSKMLVAYKEIHAHGYQMLHDAGLVRMPAEAKGDCWLISIMAGHELKLDQVKAISESERKRTLTTHREKLVHFMSNEGRSSSSASDEHPAWLNMDELKTVAMLCNIDTKRFPKHKTKFRATLEKKLSEALAPWKFQMHWGKHQVVMHAGTGWMLGCNVLEIYKATTIGECKCLIL